MKKKIILLILALCLCVGCGKKEAKEKLHIVNVDGVSVNAKEMKDGKLLIKLNASKVIDFVDVDVAFYGMDEELVKTGDAFLKKLDPNRDAYIYVDMPKDINGNTIELSKADIKVNTSNYEESTITSYVSEVSAKYEKEKDDENRLIITIENKSKETLSEVQVASVFYKNNEEVGAVVTYLMNVGETANQTIYVPSVTKDSEANYVEYDEVKLYVNSALKNK